MLLFHFIYVSVLHVSLRICLFLFLFFLTYKYSFTVTSVSPLTIASTSRRSIHHSITLTPLSSSLSLSVPLARPHCHYHRTLRLSFTVVMNAFPNGTRVFYWDVNSMILYGTVESTSRMTDGTQVVNVKVDGGSIVSLPASSVSKVT